MYQMQKRTFRWSALLALFFALGSAGWYLPGLVSASFSSNTFTAAVVPAVGVATFAANCTTPQTAFAGGGTVCAQVTGIDPPIANARFDFVDPDGIIQQRGPDITADGQTATYALPANPTAGTWRVNISYNSDSSVIATTEFTIIACPVITLNPPTLPNANLNVAYGQTITASPAGSYTFSVTGGSLPAGLTLNTNGTWSGAPTALGSSSFTVTAQDANGCIGSQSYTLMVVCPSISVLPATLPAAAIDAVYPQNLTTAGGMPPVLLSVTSGSLPTGLTLNPNGTWSGVPTALGNFSFTVTAQDASGCTGSQNYSILVVCPVISLTPATLPGTPAGSPYSQQLSVAGGGSFNFSLTNGTLPLGLSLNASGLLGGTPAESGTFNFRVTATTPGGQCSNFRDYTLVVDCTTIDLTPTSLPGGSIGTAYNQTVSGTPSGTYSYAVSSGALPPGLTLNAATGAITGTPATNGSSTFTITATAGACSGSRTYTVAIGCPSISLTTTSPLPAGSAGVAYSQMLNVTPAGSYTFSLTSGGLPGGVTLNTSTGVISGTPTVTGTSTFTVKAQAANGCSATQSYTLAINCPGITLAPASLPGGTTGTAYSQTIAASPAGGGYTYAVSSGSLPTGLNLNLATGSLSGTPTANATFTFTITATGFGGCTGSQSYTVVIGGGGGCSTITLPATLPNGNVGQLYNAAATASPAGLYSYTVTSGSLPPGVTLFAANGLLFGFPTAMGSYAFTITATQGACSGSRMYTVLIGTGFASSLTAFSDFDGDGKSDLSVFRGGNQEGGNWLVAGSGNGQVEATVWGASFEPYNDLPVPGDYDGDGKTDLAVFRRGGGQAGYWFIKRSSDGEIGRYFWGLPTDLPVPGDYDGDGKMDVAVWRGSAGAWYILRSSDGGVDGITWGAASLNDLPVPGDYDGDFITDAAVFRRGGAAGPGGDWYIKRSSDGLTISAKWGVGTDVPVPGDYDGDSRTDIAVWRASEGNWYIVESGNAMTRTISFGAAQGDVPVAADYDGDGKADAAVWQAPSGIWRIMRSSDGAEMSKSHGQSGDTPVMARRN